MADLDLRVRENGVPGELLGSSVTQLGGLDVEIRVSSLEGGEIRVAEGIGEELSLQMPAYIPQGPYPRAVLSVTADDPSRDIFAPGDADFTFGIDFWAAAASAGRDLDNGDNMIQRGLASDPSQFKLELDGGRALCRIAGSGGAVQVRSKKAVEPERWYRAECTRQGSVVTLSVTLLEQSAVPTDSPTTGSGAIGTLAWDRPETPLSVGGKLAPNGAVIRSATDQFNGRLANPRLTISRR